MGGEDVLTESAFDYAVEYVHDRKQFGAPVGTFQLMQGMSKSLSECPPCSDVIVLGKIADMYTKLTAARSYVYAVARACDAGKISRRVSGAFSALANTCVCDTNRHLGLLQDCAGAILYSSDRAVEVALEAMQCLGGNGYINGEWVGVSNA